jgi:hypothetical protein
MSTTAVSVPIAILLLLAAATAPAPPRVSPPAPTVSDPDTIVVTGSRLTRHGLETDVESVTVDTDGQIAMFEQPICPASFGLPDAYNRIVEQRLREDAARVGLRTAPERCDANVVVIVADAPGPFVAALHAKRPDMFAGLELNRIQDILKAKEPVRTWQAIEPRGEDGRPLERLMFINGMPAGPNAWLNSGTLGSRLVAKIKPRLVSSFVVIDANALDGLTLTQIADYAAMRTLARTRFSPTLDRRSILGILQGAGQDRTVYQLTQWDLGYLRALYRTGNGVSTRVQQTDMTSLMKREFERAGAAEH